MTKISKTLDSILPDVGYLLTDAEKWWNGMTIVGRMLALQYRNLDSKYANMKFNELPGGVADELADEYAEESLLEDEDTRPEVRLA